MQGRRSGPKSVCVCVWGGGGGGEGGWRLRVGMNEGGGVGKFDKKYPS